MSKRKKRKREVVLSMGHRRGICCCPECDNQATIFFGHSQYCWECNKAGCSQKFNVCQVKKPEKEIEYPAMKPVVMEEVP